MQLRVRTIVLVACAVLVLSTGGCGWAQLLGPSDERLLEAVSLTSDDAAAGATFSPYSQGDVVAGQDSLDLCDASFPSERLRIGRHQVGISKSAADEHVSSEAILYSTPAEAGQAMGELEAARQGCPTTPQSPDDSGVALTWRFGAAPDTDWPEHEGVTRQAYAFTVTVQDDNQAPTEATAVYLQRGRMILALYSTPPESPEGLIVNSPDPARFTEVMTQRLLALPEHSLEQGDPDKRVEDPRDLGT